MKKQQLPLHAYSFACFAFRCVNVLPYSNKTGWQQHRKRLSLFSFVLAAFNDCYAFQRPTHTILYRKIFFFTFFGLTLHSEKILYHTISHSYHIVLLTDSRNEMVRFVGNQYKSSVYYDRVCILRVRLKRKIIDTTKRS